MKRIFRFLFFILLLLFLGAWLFPLVFKDAIVERVKAEANANLDAELNFESVDLSLISTFPYFGFSLEGLSIDGKGAFAGKRLVEVGDFGLKIDLMSVVSGETYQIEKIELSDVNLHLIINEDGSTNFDIVKTEPSADTVSVADESPSPFQLALRSYSLENFNLHYEDLEGNMELQIKELNHTGKGDFSQSLVALKTETSIAALSFFMDDIAYLKKVQLGSDFDLDFDQESFSFNFGENQVRLNELVLNFSGSLAMPGEDIDMDLKFDAPKNAFKNLISLIPAYYYQDFEDLKASGDFNLVGAMKGTFNSENEVYPAFAYDLRVRNGLIQYPDLPSSIQSLNMDLAISNNSNKLEGTKINLSRLEAVIAGSPIKGNFQLSDPLGDPSMLMSFMGRLDMANLLEVFPMPGYNASGTIEGDFAMASKLSSVEKEQYDRIKASGFIKVNELAMDGDSVPMPVRIGKGELSLSPQKAVLSKTDLHVASTDLSIDGELNNMLAYLMSDDPLRASLNLYSPKMDMADFMPAENSAEETSSTDSSALAVIRLPENVDLKFNALIDELIYDGMLIKKLKGMVLLKEAKLYQELSMNMLGGKVALNGSYDSKPQDPNANFKLDLQNCSFAETYRNLDMVKSIAPIMENLVGNYFCQFNFSTSLDQNLDPVLKTLAGAGNLRTTELISSTATMKQLASFLNNPTYEKIKVSGVNMNFKIVDGQVSVEPFDFKLAGQKSTLGGNMGLDQSLDFDLSTDVPLSALKASNLQSRFSAFSSGVVPLKVAIGGTATKPSIKPNLGDITGSLVNEAKQQVKAKVEETVQKAKEDVNKKLEALVAEAEAKGDALIAQAQAQADKIKAEAKKQADKIRQGGEEAAKKIMDEAGSNPLKKMAAKPLADKARNEANEKAQALEDKAKKEADKLVEAARNQKQKLIEDAKAKAQL